VKQPSIETRNAILQKNFQSIFKNGYQATRTDKVIAELGITKGAFYHYFPDKMSMGLAIIDEILRPMYASYWENAQNSPMHPIDTISEALNHIGEMASEESISLGCPLNNLSQEMATIDETFRAKLAEIINHNIKIIAGLLTKGIENGQILPTIEPYSAACFVWASLEGCFGLGKALNSLPAFRASLETLLKHLQAMKI
jgi:AcrR family transcriptional regulator